MPTFGGGVLNRAAGNPGAAAPANGVGADPYSEIDKLFQDVLSQHEKSWSDTQAQLGKQQQNLMRRAELYNARMGRGLGGGFASLQGAALGEGADALARAKLQHDRAGNELLLGRIDSLTNRAERGEERDWQVEDRDLGWQRDTAMQVFEAIRNNEMSEEDAQKILQAMGITDPEILAQLGEYGASHAPVSAAEYGSSEADGSAFVKDENGNVTSLKRAAINDKLASLIDRGVQITPELYSAFVHYLLRAQQANGGLPGNETIWNWYIENYGS
jgi:hypothetical protein